MTARTKLAVFFMLNSLIFPIFPAHSAKNDAPVNLSVEVREVVSVGTENNKLAIQTNGMNAFLVLVYDESDNSTTYLPADSNLSLEADKFYTIIPAP
jgi:hypothetical protein